MAQQRKFKGLYGWTLLGVVLVAVVLINIISSLTSVRVDITEDQRYSLAKGTQEYLGEIRDISSRLNIKIYLDGNLPAEINHFRNAIEDKLKEFKAYAGDRIEYQFINPHVGTKEEQQELYDQLFAKGQGILPMDIVYLKDGSQNQILLWPGAVIEYGGSTVNTIQFLPGSKTGQPFQLNGMTDIIENSMNNLEYILVSSLRRATQKERPRIGFLQGHGELQFKETQRIRGLIAPYFSLRDVQLNDSIHALDELDGLIIARPTRRFTNKDLYIIDQFVMRGGRLMCFIDKLYMPEDTLKALGQTHTKRYLLGLENMLFDYGLKINDNYIIDARCAPKQVPFADQSIIPWFYHVLATPTSHPISRNVEPVSMPYSNEIQFVGDNSTIALQPILTSSTNATATGLAPMVNLAMPLNYGEQPQLVPNPENEANKKCLAGLAEGMFESHFKNRLVASFADNPDSKFRGNSVKEGKVILIGNGRFIANRYDSIPSKTGNGWAYRPKAFNELQYSEEMAQMKIPHFFGNQEFFQNLVDYMMGETSVLDIRSRQIDIHEIDKEKVATHSGFYKVLNIGLPIFLILLLGFIMNLIRKKKYAR